MIREKIAQTNFAKDKGFRWRGTEVSRMEGFSDNVFGFALTLLVVSLEVPRTFSDLEETFRGFIAFALAFALLFSFWYYHYKFFRRYGIEDDVVIWLNAFQLFVILFFVYPLKFLFTFLVKMFSGMPTDVALPNGSIIPSIRMDQWTTLMVAYGLGFIIIYGIFVILHFHALRKRKELELDDLEILLTKSAIAAYVTNCLVGGVSIFIILFWGVKAVIFSGFSYMLLGPLQASVGIYFGKKINKIRKATHPSV